MTKAKIAIIGKDGIVEEIIERRIKERRAEFNLHSFQEEQAKAFEKVRSKKEALDLAKQELTMARENLYYMYKRVGLDKRRTNKDKRKSLMFNIAMEMVILDEKINSLIDK